MLIGGPAVAQTPTPSPPAPATPPAPALPTSDFVQATSSMDAYEQRAGKIASVMGTSLEVRRFSRTMVDDHARSAMALVDAMSKAGLPVPTADLSASQTASVKDLYAVAPKDFDRTYVTNEIDSHQQALDMAQAYAAGGDNAAVKQVASGLIPAIQRELDQAKLILSHVR